MHSGAYLRWSSTWRKPMTTFALIDQVTRWWDSFSLAKPIFYGIALTAGLVSLILMMMAVFGMEHDDAVDAIASDGDIRRTAR